MNLFFDRQEEEMKKNYIELLKITGALSRLFSDSSNPYLYYRSMENIFCKVFKANDLSRSDISVDASKDGQGIGLKTFLHNNGRTFQKVAEFNKESYLFKNLNPKELVEKVSSLRNERIQITKDISSLESIIYHVVTRSNTMMSIFEETMNFVDLNSISKINNKKTTISFSDRYGDYTFSKSKNTLLKRFDVNKLQFISSFNVSILKDPYDFLLSNKEKIVLESEGSKDIEFKDFIVLPLYSYRNKKVMERSGLNMWNAGGRPRDKNEVYIPIPKFLHDIKPEFFKYRDNESLKTNSFNVVLPNRKVLSMKVTQSNGKALQSDPNKELGKWLLRDVLKVKPDKLVTKELLDAKGIDSIKLSKVNEDLYYMDFLKVGSFEEFLEEHIEDVS